MGTSVVSADYEVPTYRAEAGTVWFHFLHGNVPGHQIDFMYRPAVPQGPLTRQHFSHLARLVKYIEPRHDAAYAFAIGNLSRDDTQYEPGRGGVALIFGLRIKGAKDHAGRQDPPFCHSAALIDRHLDAQAIHEAAMSFYKKLLPDEESEAEGSGWYHTYVQCAQNPDALSPLLRRYVTDFEDLPTPVPSGLGLRWSVEHATPPKRVVVVYPDQAPFEEIARCAARIGEVLVESDIRWTVISNGREGDIGGGVTVRFVPRHEAMHEAGDVITVAMEDVPEAPWEIAEKLFRAHEVRVSQMPELRMGWRQMVAQQAKATAGEGAGQGLAPGATENRASPKAPSSELATGEVQVDLGAIGADTASKEGAEESKAALGLVAEVKPSGGSGKKAKSQIGLLVGLGVAIALAGVIAAVALGTGGSTDSRGNATPLPSGPPEVREVPTAMVVEPPSPMPSATTTASSAAGSTTPQGPPATSASAAGSEKAPDVVAPKTSAPSANTKKGGTTSTTKKTKKEKSMFDIEQIDLGTNN